MDLRGRLETKKGSRRPVSYTHLDVYKRQGLGYALLRTLLLASFNLTDEALLVDDI